MCSGGRGYSFSLLHVCVVGGGVIVFHCYMCVCSGGGVIVFHCYMCV